MKPDDTEFCQLELIGDSNWHFCWASYFSYPYGRYSVTVGNNFHGVIITSEPE